MGQYGEPCGEPGNSNPAPTFQLFCGLKKKEKKKSDFSRFSGFLDKDAATMAVVAGGVGGLI